MLGSKQRFRDALKAQQKASSGGVNGILLLKNIFKKLNVDDSGYISWDQFCAALQMCGLTPSPRDIRALFLELDQDSNNKISYNEFINCLRVEMSPAKIAVIVQAFEAIDLDNDGIISITDIGRRFVPKNHPLVKNGTVTIQKMSIDFLDSFGAISDNGYISISQFIDFYNNGHGHEDDEEFINQMVATWNLSAKRSTPNYGETSVGKLWANDRCNAGVSKNMELLREQLQARGARGIIGLQRKFRIIDDDGNKSLNLHEFKKCLVESGIKLTDLQLNQIFAHFDADANGCISFDEFLFAIRGPLNDRRVAIVLKAFAKLDRDGSGVVEPEDIINVYNASKHPDVLAGIRSEDEVLQEFLETYDVGKDGKVSLADFLQYYSNVGASIDNDEFFESMVSRAWNLDGVSTATPGVSTATPSAKNGRVGSSGALLQSAEQKPSNNRTFISTFSLGNEPSPAPGAREVLMKATAQKSIQQQDANVLKASYDRTGTDSATLKIAEAGPKDKALSQEKKMAKLLENIGTVNSNSGSVPDAGIIFIVQKLKTALEAHGAHGFLGLSRKFKIWDDNGDRGVGLAEFKKGMMEMKMGLSESELRLLFNHFDRDGSSRIDFEEFLSGIRDPLNAQRLSLVRQAFNKLDKDGSGIVDAVDIASVYNASKHPEVIAGRRTSESVLREWLDNFDCGGVIDGKVTFEEFCNYYTNIGANIDNDEYFALMITNAYQLSKEEKMENEILLESTKGNSKEQLKTRDAFASSFALYVEGAVESENPHKNIRRFSTAHVKTTIPAGILPGLKNADGKRVIAIQSQNRKKDGEALTASAPVGVRIVIDQFKSALAKKGANGFLGLARKFKIADDDNSKSLSYSEFKKAVLEMDMSLSDSNLRLLFNHFDVDNTQSIDFEEFIAGIRDPLNARRLSLVRQAFNILDKDGSGIVDAVDIASVYNASKHPEVIAGRRTSESVLREFLDTFDCGGVVDGKVTEAEFIQYYTNLGASVDLDSYFELMIRNAWHISGGEGWSQNSANRRVLVTDAQGNESVQEIKQDLGLSSGDIVGMTKRLNQQGVTSLSNISVYDGYNDMKAPATKSHFSLGQQLTSNSPIKAAPQSSHSSGIVQEIKKEGMMERLRAHDVFSNQINIFSGAGDAHAPKKAAVVVDSYGMGRKKIVPSNVFKSTNLWDDERERDAAVFSKLPPPPPTTTTTPATAKGGYSLSSVVNNNPGISADYQVMQTLADLKVQLKNRGAHGIIGLARKFRIFDDNNDRGVSLAEFKKAMAECALSLTDTELRLLFNHFDRDGSSRIDFEEFLNGVREPLNARRLSLVRQAFNILDKDGSGIVDAVDIASVYNASKHPEVIAGRRTSESVLREFLDTFDCGGVVDGKVTEAEFIQYYTNLGASVDLDSYFELMIRNAWHISGGEGWSQNSANRRVLVTDAHGNESVQEIKQDLGLTSKAALMAQAQLEADESQRKRGGNPTFTSTFSLANKVEHMTIGSDSAHTKFNKGRRTPLRPTSQISFG